jgi:hypothetical protein
MAEPDIARRERSYSDFKIGQKLLYNIQTLYLFQDVSGWTNWHQIKTH